MRLIIIFLTCILFASCSKLRDDSPVTATKPPDSSTAADTTELSAITIQISNVDYGFVRVNQWSYGGFSESFKGFGPKINSFNESNWPSTFVHFYMNVYLRNANCSFPPDSFRYYDLANRSSIDTAIVEVGLTPSNSIDYPWAVYSNVITTQDRQVEWVSISTGRVGINKYLPCPYTNPGHTRDMNIKLENVLLSLVDSSGSLTGYDFPRTVLVKSSFFKVIKN